MSDDVTIDGFTRSTFTHGGYERPVYSGGSGPAVIVIHEVPGLHPGVVSFGRRVVERGFHVRMPSLYQERRSLRNEAVNLSAFQ